MCSDQWNVQAGTSDVDVRLPNCYKSADDWRMFRKSNLWLGSLPCKAFSKEGVEDEVSAV